MERELILICEGNLDGGFHSITKDPDVLYQDDSGLSHPMALHRSLWRAGNTVDVLGGADTKFFRIRQHCPECHMRVSLNCAIMKAWLQDRHQL